MESHFVLNPVATNMLRTDVVIERLCRTCLLEQEESHPLFENSVDQILMYCTSIQISKYDGFPSKICNSCLLKAQQAYDFKQQVENSEVTLKQYFCLYQKEEQPLKEVKEEVIELDTGFNSVIIKNELILQDVKDEIQETPYVSEIELKQEHREGTQSNTIHFKCTKCIKYFSNEEDLELHNLSHIRKRFICHICNNSYKHKSTLKSHVLIHAMSDKVHACTECDKRYALSSQLIIHMRTHTGEKPFLCSICGKGYIKPEYLARHTKIHTGIQKKWECDICHKRFIDFYKLRVHKMVHTGEKPFVCSVCGHLSRTSALLKSHMKIHTKEKPYHCSMCPKTFSNRSGLTVHQVTHSGERNHICKICGKGISSAFYLKRHLRIHTGERPYSCTEPNCDLKFTSNIGLKTHVRKHKGIFHSEKPHCCTICLKMFGRSGQLKEHMNSHTGMKPHVCSICGKKFAHSRSLYRHKKEHKLIEN